MTRRLGHALRGVGLQLTFWEEFLRRPRQVASILASSRFLEQRLVEISEAPRARLVVEMGPGTGGTTQALLKAMRDNSALLAIELIPSLARQLSTISDARLIVEEADAVGLRSILRKRQLARPDRIICGIPLSSLKPQTAHWLMAEIRDILEPGGSFVAYQFRDSIVPVAQSYFGPPDVFREYRNFPPLWIYRWRKGVGVERGLDERLRTTGLVARRLGGSMESTLHSP